MQATELRKRLRARIGEASLLVAPGVADVLSAQLVRSIGFEALFLSGSLLHRLNGYPDANVLSMPELAAAADTICDRVALPVIADGEDGFGYDLNLRRMMRAYERAGVSAIHIEDTAAPPVPSHVRDGATTVSKAQFLDKIKTALDERRDGALVIIARCEVKGDFDEKRDRLAAAIELGADAFWFATHEAADVRRLKDALGRPGFGVLAGGRSPQQFADLGASCGVIPSAMAMAAVAGQMDMLRDLKANGVLNAWLDRQPGMAEVRTFLEG